MIRQHTVIAFDISGDRARRAATRVLEDHLERVQRSVFEHAALPGGALVEIETRLREIVDPATDSLRYYRLCNACAGRIIHAGAGLGLLKPTGFRLLELPGSLKTES